MNRLWLWALLLQGCFYITEDERRARWDLDGDGVERPWDCDDHDPEVQTFVWCRDADGDGYGDPAHTVEACEPPDGMVADCTDCDDSDPEVHPGAIEVCDGKDNNCDGTIDAGLQSTWYADADGDGYGDPDTAVTACEAPPGYVDNDLDCDDTDPEVHPDAEEVCDGKDNNCDGRVDFEDPAIDPADYTWYVDQDGDGWGDATKTETCAGVPIDPSQQSVVACSPPPGYGPDGDCDDCDYEVNPDAVEVCDGIDNNCDGVTDPGTAEGATVWYRDADGDGFGDPTVTIMACQQPTIEDGYDCDYVDPSLVDCDDTCPKINPLADEYCNGIDNTCNQIPGVDPDCPRGCGDCSDPDLPSHCECIEPTEEEDGICHDDDPNPGECAP